MVDVEKTAHLLPDCLYLMESFNSALDPFFGVMSIGPELPSPEHIPQVHQLIEVRTPERGLEEISQRRSCRRAVAEGPDTNIASPEMITMKEVELIKAPEFQADKDLPEVTAQELEFLMGQDIPFPETETTRKTGEPRKRHRKQVTDETEEVRNAPEDVPDRLVLSPERLKEYLGPETDSVILLDEVTGLPVEVPPLALVPSERTPLAEVPIPPQAADSRVNSRAAGQSPEEGNLPSEEVYELPPVKPTKRCRWLQYVDEVTQIPREELKKQIGGVHLHCRTLDLIEVPYKYVKVAPTELLKNPTYTSWMPPVLHELWSCSARQRAVVKQASAAPAAEEEEEVEVGRRREAASEGQVALEPSVSLVASSELSLEVSEEERLRLITPEEKHLFRTSEIKEAALPVLQEVPEPSLAPQETDLLLEEENITAAYVLGLAATKIQAFGETDFETLVPPHSTSRKVAGKIFSLCLVLARWWDLSLEQAEAFGRITITAGPRFSVGQWQDVTFQWDGGRTLSLSGAATGPRFSAGRRQQAYLSDPSVQ
ncbi:meiotic recombination protein REC8 homolog isoform X2 [Latimeria chalumnae]